MFDVALVIGSPALGNAEPLVLVVGCDVYEYLTE